MWTPDAPSDSRASSADGATAPSAWRLWAALVVAAAVMNFIWEMLEMGLYHAPNAHLWSSIWGCAIATAGDVAITVGAYAAVALAAHAPGWGDRFTTFRLASYVATGLVVTIALEVSNVHVWHRWSYAPSMPLVLGIGVAPLTQWLVFPCSPCSSPGARKIGG